MRKERELNRISKPTHNARLRWCFNWVDACHRLATHGKPQLMLALKDAIGKTDQRVANSTLGVEGYALLAEVTESEVKKRDESAWPLIADQVKSVIQNWSIKCDRDIY